MKVLYKSSAAAVLAFCCCTFSNSLVAQTTVFTDSFSRTTLLPWTVNQGTWSVNGSALLGSRSTAQNYAYAYVNTNWTDYSVEARVQFPVGAYGGGIGGRLDTATGAHYGAWIYPE